VEGLESSGPHFLAIRIFLDDPDEISVPSRVITTGRIRNYNSSFAETIGVGDRLWEICGKWSIPIETIVVKTGLYPQANRN